MKNYVRTMAGAVGAAVLLSAFASLASAQAPPDPLQGSWTNKLTGGGASTWTFTPLPGGRYDAREVGMGNARGTAVLKGNHLHIDFTTADVVGAYDVDLDAAGTNGAGQVSFSQGAPTGNIYRAAFRRIDDRVTGRPNGGVRQPPRPVPDPSANPGDLPEALQPHGGAAAGRPGVAPPEPQPLPPPVVIGEPLDPGQPVEITDDPDGPDEPAPGPPG
jgi:hypothetical protein